MARNTPSTPSTQGAAGNAAAACGCTSATQPLAAPATLTRCRSPGGIQPARCGGSSHEPASVRTRIAPLSTPNNCPRAWACQSYSREPRRNSLPGASAPWNTHTAGPSSNSL